MGLVKKKELLSKDPKRQGGITGISCIIINDRSLNIQEMRDGVSHPLVNITLNQTNNLFVASKICIFFIPLAERCVAADIPDIPAPIITTLGFIMDQMKNTFLWDHFCCTISGKMTEI